MFRFLCLENKERFPLSYLVLVLLCLAFAQTALAQDGPNVVWQTNSGGGVLAYSDDGQLLLAGTRLFAAADGTVLRDFVLPYNGGGVNSVALSPDGQYAAIGIQSFNQNLDLFRVADGAVIKGRITAHNNGTTSVAFSPDGQLLATGGRDGTAKIWHVPDMTLLRTLNGGAGYRPRVFAVAFTLDGEMLAVGGQGGVVFYHVADGELVRELTGAASTRALTISPDNQFISNATNQIDQQGQCADCALKTWRIADGALVQVIDVQNNTALSIGFSPNEQVIAAGSEDRYQSDGLIRFWDSSSGTLLQLYHVGDGDPYSTYVSGFAYSPDANFFACATTNSHVVVARNPFITKKSYGTR
jgi:WD40 repeat protein